MSATAQQRAAAQRSSGEAPITPWYRSTTAVVLVPLLALLATSAWMVWSYLVSPRGFVDLDVYRLGVQAWQQGHDMYGVLPLTNVGIELPFIYPPFATLILSPLMLLPWIPSVICMMLLSLLSLAVVDYLVVRRMWRAGGRRGAVVLASALTPLALLTEPVRDTIWFGQVNLLLMVLVALDCLVVPAEGKKLPWPRGVLVGIAAAIKLTPAIFLLFFLVRKDFRSSVNSVIAGLVATAIGFAASWSGSLKFWFGSTGGLHAQSGSPYLTNQTIWSALGRFGLSHGAQTVGWVVVLAALLAVTVIGVRRSGALTPLAMVIVGGFGLLASPVSWGHHWVYCVPAIIAMLIYAARSHRTGWWVAAVASAAVYGIAPFFFTPTKGGVAYHWSFGDQLLGNSFTIAAVMLLVLFAWPTVRQLTTGQRAVTELPRMEADSIR
ncbi:MAG: glycosyltransferase family 87 protein [Sciscionella sp.]